MVEYETDFFILRRPSAAGERRAVYDVTNRGRKVILGRLTKLEATPIPTIPNRLGVGLGFTLGRGYSLVWSGQRDDDEIRLVAPVPRR